MDKVSFQTVKPEKPKEGERRKLPLIRLTYSDLIEDSPPTSKKGKPKKQKPTVNAAPASLRKSAKPLHATKNPSNWKHVPQLRKSINGTKKNSATKSVVPDDNGFVKPKNLLMQLDKGVRKDLFGGRSNAFYKNNSNKISFQPRPLTQLPTIQLDNTQPLMDINEAEMQLNCLKLFNNIPTNKNPFTKNTPESRPTLKDVSFDIRIEHGNTSSPLNTDPDRDLDNTITSNLKDLKISARNDEETSISPTEYEFIKNEKICNANNTKVESEMKLKSCIAKANNSNVVNTIIKVFQEQQESFRHIADKFQLVEKHFNELHLEMIAFQNQCSQNVKSLVESLESAKENFVIEDVKELQKCLSDLHPARSAKKKTVAFNLHNSTENKPDRNNVELEDKGLEKAVNFYNSMRKDYKGILSTPRLDRSVLQTPISKAKSQVDKDTISRRLQKQCLLLLDTPSNKNK